MTTPIKPTTEQIDELKKQLKSIPELRKEILKAKQAGFDVDQQERDLNDLEIRLKKILAVYG